jgi:hypothetical protein
LVRRIISNCQKIFHGSLLLIETKRVVKYNMSEFSNADPGVLIIAKEFNSKYDCE